MHRRGPARRINPHKQPGGVVFRVFAGDRLVIERGVDQAEEAALLGTSGNATEALRLIDASAVRLDVYDGDSGVLIGTISTEVA